MTDPKIWYVRRHEQIQGPFAYSILKKLARLGRLKSTDQLSDNKQDWSIAAEHAELFQDCNAEIPLKDEERSGLDRRQEELEQATQPVRLVEDHRQSDRRKPEGEDTLRRRKERTRLLQDLRQNRPDDHFPKLALVISVLLMVMLGIVMTHSDEELSEPDCSVQPQPNVNWDNCQLAALQAKRSDLTDSSIRNANLIKADLQAAKLVSSNFSYTDLSGSNLKKVQLDKAILKGANLRSANLRSSSLKQADLSYADLRDADLQGADLTLVVLDKAIWIDGRLCRPGSIGQCL